MAKERTPFISVERGQIIAGRYRIEDVIASGGMGVVFAARHEELDQKVAIKVLRAEILNHDLALTRFLREARTSARLQNEHVARVFDVGRLPSGVPFMVMEHLRGLDLEQLLQTRGPLPVDDAVSYVLEALEALAEAHALGVVHRDLKPANLFLASRFDGSTQIKVLDFGISKSYEGHKGFDSPSPETSTSNLIGSPAYMSPEQVKDPKNIDGRADIWAIGTILYELLMGEPLFGGATVGQTLANVLSREVPPLRPRRGDVPAELERVILRCLEREPSRRHADVAELASDLAPFSARASQWSGNRASGVLGASGRTPLPLPTLLSERRHSMDATTLEARPTPTRKIVLGLGASLGVGLAVLVAWWGGRSEAPSAVAATAVQSSLDQGAPPAPPEPPPPVVITPRQEPQPTAAASAPPPASASTAMAAPSKPRPASPAKLKGATTARKNVPSASDILGERQ